MNNQLIECVPNFSEGRDLKKLDAIASAIRSVSSVKLLHIDRGEAANRTVFTYVGPPSDMVEATFRAIETASRVIDMSEHHGEHPRIGAADVVPFVPVSGISLDETKKYSRILSERVASELGIPVYAYEASATRPERKKLEYCRKGEYEGLALKISTPEGRPDFGPDSFTESARRSGASVIGARNFLLAVNFNLNSKSAQLASMVAADVRESGRVIDPGLWFQTEDGLWNRKKECDQNPTNQKICIPGQLVGCKAIGWYIEEYGIAQVSMNVTDMNTTPLHVVFETVSSFARLRGLRVTGTEIIGLLPLKALTDAGKYYLSLQGVNESTEYEQVFTAVRSLSLNDLPAGYDPQARIIEYLISK